MLLDKLGGASQTRMICGAPAPSLPPTKTCFRVLSRVSLPWISHPFAQPLPFSETDQSRAVSIFFLFQWDFYHDIVVKIYKQNKPENFRLSHFAYPYLLQLVISAVWCNKLMFIGFSHEHSLVGEKQVNQPLRHLCARLTCAEFRGGTAIDVYFLC